MRWTVLLVALGLALGGCDDSEGAGAAGDGNNDPGSGGVVSGGDEAVVPEGPGQCVRRSYDNFASNDALLLDHLQAKGTHNSYHLQPEGQAVTPAYAYSHLPLRDQLDCQGVRQLELDVHFSIAANDYLVYHLAGIDPRSTCNTLRECLAEVYAWSVAFRGHHLLTVFVEGKDDLCSIDPDERCLEAADFAAIDQIILETWTDPAALLRPAAVRGDAASVRAAVTAAGWPSVNASRGQTAFVLLEGGALRDGYRDLGAGINRADRLMFLSAKSDREAVPPQVAVISIDDPIENEAAVAAAVASGALVRTRADADTVEIRAGDRARLDKALALGAHFISTDRPAPLAAGATAASEYWVADPGQPSRCNPLRAPAGCVDNAIEALVRPGL